MRRGFDAICGGWVLSPGALRNGGLHHRRPLSPTGRPQTQSFARRTGCSWIVIPSRMQNSQITSATISKATCLYASYWQFGVGANCSSCSVSISKQQIRIGRLLLFLRLDCCPVSTSLIESDRGWMKHGCSCKWGPEQKRHWGICCCCCGLSNIPCSCCCCWVHWRMQWCVWPS